MSGNDRGWLRREIQRAHQRSAAVPDRPVVVSGNAYAIDDAIRNLVENAVVHAPPRTEVTVSTRADGSIDISDSGPGVPKEDRERVFERFWRGNAAPSHGAGLGLAIVAEIMKAHGGDVRVDTGPDGGAVFTLVFSPALAQQWPAEAR